MLEKILKWVNNTRLNVVFCVAYGLWAAYEHWEVQVACVLGAAVLTVANHYGDRLKALETELAALRAERALVPTPTQNQTSSELV